jgi:hypothetical protein
MSVSAHRSIQPRNSRKFNMIECSLRTPTPNSWEQYEAWIIRVQDRFLQAQQGVPAFRL